MKIHILIISILIYNGAFGQNNLIFSELGGNGGLFSANYERQLTRDLGLSLRVGLGITAFDFEKEEPFEPVPGCVACGIDIPAVDLNLTIPISLHYLFSLGRANYVEAGLGYTWQIPKSKYDESSIHVFYGSTGFRRYFGKGKKWMWKMNFSPIIGARGENVDRRSEPAIWAGFAIGKRF